MQRIYKAGSLAGMVLVSAVVGCGNAAPSPPLATVNGQAITEHQWQVAVGSAAILQKRPMPSGTTAKRAQVEELVQQGVVAQWVIRHHVMTQKAASAQAAHNLSQRIIPSLGGNGAFNAALHAHHISRSDFLGYLAEQSILQAAFNRVTKTVAPASASAAYTYYRNHSKDFVSPTTRLIRMIDVHSHALATSLVSQVQKGASFTALALKYSTDKSTAKRGGSLGWVILSQLHWPASTVKTIKALASGHLGIVKQGSGYSIIEVQATRPGGQMAFSTVKPEIEAQLTQTAKESAFQHWVLTKTHAAHVKVLFRGA